MSSISIPADLHALFSSTFDADKWSAVLAELFPHAEFLSDPIPFGGPEADGSQGFFLGDVDLPDSVRLAFYRFSLPSRRVGRCRVSLRQLANKMKNRAQDADAVLAVFEGHDGWRVSLVSDIAGLDKGSSPRRFTFLLGRKDETYRTPVERFTAFLGSDRSFAALRDAFSVEALTRQFYKELFEWFSWAVSEGSHITFPSDTTTEDDDRDDIETKVIRMITRIIFVWFIKQKDLVPARIFDVKYLKSVLRDFNPDSDTVGDFYNAILQNLFFATLNRAIEDEQGNRRRFATSAKRDIKTLYRYEDLFAISKDEVVDLFSQVPFLNGGLFECLDKTKTIDGVERAYNYDGFSRNDKTFADGRYRNRAVVPNALFFAKENGLFSILSRYNFTIEENTPDDQKVALDPELLGKVFENLLGAYNPETKETARNQSGSFYTPREVVNYMVDESLKAYTGNSPLLAKLIDCPDFIPATDDPDHVADYAALADRLRSVRILDPACGSGAFPMGMMNRMVDILSRIEPDADPYERKLHVIENCIYGSDIQCIAIQITKLRFFISLICDCEKDPAKPNFGIPTLPNLETKFVAADTLKGKHKRESIGNLFADGNIDAAKEQLIRIRHDHFSAKTAYRKSDLRKKDGELREKLAQLLAANDFYAPDDAKQLAAWNPYDQKRVADFFDPGWMFGIEGGFDIVIGNPPYVQLQANGGKLAKAYEGEGYATLSRTGDLYCLFYERGWQLLHDGGHLCFITSNKWMRAGYGEKTRDFFAKKTNPMLLIDFAGVKIFESATVDTNILLFAKAPNLHQTLCAVANKRDACGGKELSVLARSGGTVCGFRGADSWVILSPLELGIKRKIEAAGTPLKDWDINIYRGVLTGYNDAFIVTTERRGEILAACRTEEERARTAALIRPILRGRDIRRYGYQWAGLWLINTHNGIKGELERIHIEDYPAVKEHLDKYWDKISTRSDKGDTPYNLRNCAYMGDFARPKIVYPNMTKYLPFAYDEKGYITNQKCFILTGAHMAYLTAFFNSSLFKFCFRDSFPELQGETRELSKIFFDKIPVKDVSDDKEAAFREMVNGIESCYSEEKAVLIDNAIFDLYGLTEDERKAIGFVVIR